VLVADCAGTVAGTLDCAVLPNLTRGARPFMLIENVGVGSALLAAAVGLARQAGRDKLQLLSRAGRHTAHAFYQAAGFQAVAQGYRRYLD
jgi:N-acetylglutamate synthase-like GNAT family acetyltransferase